MCIRDRGKAGGLLASWAFPSLIVPLSFQLHQDLSDIYQGEQNWDYRRLSTISLEADVRDENIKLQKDKADLVRKEKEMQKAFSKTKLSNKSKDLSSSSSSSGSNSNSEEGSGVDSNEEGESNEDEESSLDRYYTDDELYFSVTNSMSDVFSKNGSRGKLDSSPNATPSTNMESTSNYQDPLPRDLDWIKKEFVETWSSLGGRESTAQVHPYKFTKFLLKKAMESGAIDVVLGKVTGMDIDDSDDQNKFAHGVTYTPILNPTKQHVEDDNELLEPPEPENIHIQDVQQVIVTTGPWTAQLLKNCPISGLRAHSITIKPVTTHSSVAPYAIFTELKVNDTQYFSPELYARRDEVYVCGEGDTLTEVPDPIRSVEYIKEKCDELYSYVSKISGPLAEGHVLKRQACYLPVLNVATSSGPLLGETNVSNLFIASGHSCWGINNGPATGKIMAELLLEGESKSADISSLSPKLYFDASII